MLSTQSRIIRAEGAGFKLIKKAIIRKYKTMPLFIEYKRGEKLLQFFINSKFTETQGEYISIWIDGLTTDKRFLEFIK